MSEINSNTCIFCGKRTSFKYEGAGEYHGKTICPKCMSEKLGTNFNTGCRTTKDGKSNCIKEIKR